MCKESAAAVCMLPPQKPKIIPNDQATRINRSAPQAIAELALNPFRVLLLRRTIEDRDFDQPEIKVPLKLIFR